MSLKDYIAKKAREDQKNVQFYPYYSYLRVRATRTGAGPYVYTVAQQQIRAFSYKVGDPLEQAGFAPGSVATLAETNLTAGGSQTNENSAVEIYGVCAQWSPNSEPKLVRELTRRANITLSLGGSYTYTVGPTFLLPSPGGLHGIGTSFVEPGPNNSTTGAQYGALVNGYPAAQSFRKLPLPVLWLPQGAGKDASLNIALSTFEAFTFSGDNRAADPTIGVEAFAAAETVFADLCFSFVNKQIGDRSVNA